MRLNRKTLLVVVCACLWWNSSATTSAAYYFGHMKADDILFLGNSITLTLPNNWGASASEQSKDYVHLLAGKIDAETGGTLELTPMAPELVDGQQQPGTANILNVAHIFERNYATYTASKLEYQLAQQPDLVVLQFGENIPGDGFDATVFETALRTLVSDLKNSGNPNIFFASHILDSNATVDAIKREIVAEDPTHRVFVDLSVVMQDAANVGAADHPSDAGMAVIADTMFDAMQSHAAPEPGSLVLAAFGAIGLFGYAWRMRK